MPSTLLYASPCEETSIHAALTPSSANSFSIEYSSSASGVVPLFGILRPQDVASTVEIIPTLFPNSFSKILRSIYAHVVLPFVPVIPTSGYFDAGSP